MQRRNFLSSVFAALVAAKAVNAEERKLSPEVSEETKTKFDENTLLDTIKDDPAFSGYSNLLFPRGRTEGLRLREVSRLLPYHSYVMPKESAEVFNYMKDEALKSKKIFYPLKTASNGSRSSDSSFSGVNRMRLSPLSVRAAASNMSEPFTKASRLRSSWQERASMLS